MNPRFAGRAGPGEPAALDICNPGIPRDESRAALTNWRLASGRWSDSLADNLADNPAESLIAWLVKP